MQLLKKTHKKYSFKDWGEKHLLRVLEAEAAEAEAESEDSEVRLFPHLP